MTESGEKTGSQKCPDSPHSPAVDLKNDAQWIAHFASVPAADLREEARRCARI
ncbi:MAG: hypothetical protein RDV48_11265 [Candidatus Eremiobacteraeota bacterium]|nr:hypothetical protein [Candidatus Eremiobacteraeota bacterium]